MDIITSPNVLERSIVRTCEYGKDDCCAIDQQAVLSFNIDPLTGRPLYDLTGILRSQNMLEQQRLLDGLEQFKADYLPADVSDDQAFEFYEPRLCQLPSEKADLLARRVDDRLKLERLKAEQAERDRLLSSLDPDVVDDSDKSK